MHTPLPKIDFSRIREHESSQQRAWEELAFLLVPDIERLPAGTRLERRATPDAGIEFACSAPTGPGSETWAWQAKYLHNLDNSAIQQMRKSLFDALDSTPTLTRYAFVLPIDRSAGVIRGRISALERWNRAVERWRREATERGRQLDVAYIGHSELLAALQLDRHAGAIRYFFDETLFTADFFKHQVDREVVNLGERYDPEVHVDVDLGAYLDAVARTPAFADRVAVVLKRCVKATGRLAEASTASESIRAAVQRSTTAGAGVSAVFQACTSRLTEPGITVFRELDAALLALTGALDELDVITETELAALPAPASRHPTGSRQGRRRSRSKEHLKDPTASIRRVLNELRQRTTSAQGAAGNARRLLSSPAVQTASLGTLLITGPAGCGKSHMVADAAMNRTALSSPTLLLLGQHLGAGPVWPQLCQQLDLAISADDLLAALSVAAQVRGQGRALLIIDAINEGAGADVWPDQLAGFLTDCAAHPWVAVVLTVRDTYRREVLPARNLPLTEVLHQGLAGHEEEALHRYAAHYQLRLPDFPPLLPELTNPLFLRSLCRSVRARGHDAIPREASSLSWVFDGLLSAANAAVSHPRRLDRDLSDEIAGRAVTALAEALLDTDEEYLPFSVARDLCDAIHPESRFSRSLLNALVTEGVLLRERVRSGSGAEPVDQVRFTYQRMADHVRAETMLARQPSDSDLRATVLELCSGPGLWRRRGLLEALVLLSGERRGIELAPLLGLGPSGPQLTDEQERLRVVFADAFFAALPWRDPATLDGTALDLLREYLDAGYIQNTQWLTLLLSLACIPEHPLNVRRLDRALRDMSMPARDRLWSQAVLGIAYEDSNPVSRTIDWAWSCRDTVSADVVDLAATILSWLLTSPNRRIRDTATKALLRLTGAHTSVLARLVRGLEGVDDPYVAERVIAVACGHVVRRAHDRFEPGTLAELLELGRAVFDVSFGAGVSTHILLRHYARTAVEVVDRVLRAHGAELDRQLSWAAPPYESPWPLVAPSKRTLATGYQHKPSSYLWAVSELGMDFERYIIKRLVDDFVLPDQLRRRATRRAGLRRRLNSARENLATALNHREDVIRQVDEALVEPDLRQQRRAFERLRQNIPDELHRRIEELESLAWQTARAGDDPVRPDPDLVGRWIAARVLERGWAPREFGLIDQGLGELRSHGSGETERYAKKYAWIAFFEVAGHLADHCPVQRYQSDAPVSYDGPWQLGYIEDIDPTTDLCGDQPPDETAAARLRAHRLDADRRAAWWLTGTRHQLHSSGTDEAWLEDTTDMPDPMKLVSATDPGGGDWALVELSARWRVAADPGSQTWQRDRRQLHLHSRSLLIPAADVDRFLGWASSQRWDNARLPEPIEPHVPFLKGYPYLERWPDTLQQIFEERGITGDWMPLDVDASAVNATSTTAACANRADNDFSNRDYGPILLPALPLYRALRVSWCNDSTVTRRLGLARYEAEHCWAANGQIAAFSSDGPGFYDPRAFYVRQNALRDVLVSTDVALVTTIYAEKIFWRGSEPSRDRGEMHAVIRRTEQGPVLVSRTHVAQLWHDDDRVEMGLE